MSFQTTYFENYRFDTFQTTLDLSLIESLGVDIQAVTLEFYEQALIEVIGVYEIGFGNLLANAGSTNDISTTGDTIITRTLNKPGTIFGPSGYSIDPQEVFVNLKYYYFDESTQQTEVGELNLGLYSFIDEAFSPIDIEYAPIFEYGSSQSLSLDTDSAYPVVLSGEDAHLFQATHSELKPADGVVLQDGVYNLSITNSISTRDIEYIVREKAPTGIPQGFSKEIIEIGDSVDVLTEVQDILLDDVYYKINMFSYDPENPVYNLGEGLMSRMVSTEIISTTVTPRLLGTYTNNVLDYYYRPGEADYTINVQLGNEPIMFDGLGSQNPVGERSILTVEAAAGPELLTSAQGSPLSVDSFSDGTLELLASMTFSDRTGFMVDSVTLDTDTSIEFNFDYSIYENGSDPESGDELFGLDVFVDDSLDVVPGEYNYSVNVSDSLGNTTSIEQSFIIESEDSLLNARTSSRLDITQDTVPNGRWERLISVLIVEGDGSVDLGSVESVFLSDDPYELDGTEARRVIARDYNSDGITDLKVYAGRSDLADIADITSEQLILSGSDSTGQSFQAVLENGVDFDFV